MAEYDSAIAIARRLIQKKGRIITFYKLDTSTLSQPADQPWKANVPGAGNPSLEIFVPVAFVQVARLPLWGFEISVDDMEKRATEAFICAPPADGTDMTTFQGCMDDPTANGPRFAFEWIAVLKPGTQVVLYAMGIKR